MDFKKIAGEIGSRLDSLEIFLRGPNYPSIPKAAQHTISPVAPQEPLQSPSGPTSQPSQSLSATNIQPPPYSLTAKDEPQSTSAAPSEPPPYSSIAPDEPQSSSAATSEPPKSPPDHASQSSRSSESLEIVPAPRLADSARYCQAFEWRVDRLMENSSKLDSLREIVDAKSNDPVKATLKLFRHCLPKLLNELLELLWEEEEVRYSMLRQWMCDEDKSLIIAKYFALIPDIDRRTETTTFNSAIVDIPFRHLFYDYLLTSEDVVATGDQYQTFDVIEKMRASESLSQFYDGLLAQGHTMDRGASDDYFRGLIVYDHGFREREFREWRTAHKKTIKYGKRAVQAGRKAMGGVIDCSKLKESTDAAELFQGAVMNTLKHMSRMDVYEKMINNDLKTMGNLLGIENPDPFLQLPLKDREKVFDQCNRFRLHKSEDPQPSED